MRIYYVYILKCADNSYYTGITSNISKRLEEHQTGRYPDSYTFYRKPLQLAFYAEFTHPEIAIETEKKIKNGHAQKKEALIEGRYNDLPNLAKKKFKNK